MSTPTPNKQQSSNFQNSRFPRASAETKVNNNTKISISSRANGKSFIQEFQPVAQYVLSKTNDKLESGQKLFKSRSEKNADAVDNSRTTTPNRKRGLNSTHVDNKCAKTGQQIEAALSADKNSLKSKNWLNHGDIGATLLSEEKPPSDADFPDSTEASQTSFNCAENHPDSPPESQQNQLAEGQIMELRITDSHIWETFKQDERIQNFIVESKNFKQEFNDFKEWEESLIKENSNKPSERTRALKIATIGIVFVAIIVTIRVLMYPSLIQDTNLAALWTGKKAQPKIEESTFLLLQRLCNTVWSNIMYFFIDAFVD